MIHQRFGMRWIPRRGYAKRLLQVHRLHHASSDRDNGYSFGFLFAPDPARLRRKLKQRTGQCCRRGAALRG